MNTGAKELELKFAVADESALARVEAALGPAPLEILQQHNVYFDADRRLTDARWSLRLRRENDRIVLTLKGPKEGDSALMNTRPETPDVPITEGVAAAILAGTTNALDHLASGLEGTPDAAYVETAKGIVGAAIPKRHGEIRNERRTYPIVVAGLELTAEIDRTDYGPYGRFFEVELEVPAAASDEQKAEVQRWLEAKFTALGLPIVGAPGKQARLYGFIGS